MGFDSSGNWSSDFYPVTDRDNSVPILASKFETLIQTNLKSSFEKCLLRDGTGKPTANINWNGYKITNLANGTSGADAINKGQLDSSANTKVTKSGDAMTGQLEMAGTGTSAIKMNVTNVTDKFKDIAAYNGDDRFAGLRLEYTGQSARVAGLYARDTNSNISQLRIYYDSNNNVITSAPACDVNNSIVTTVAKSKSANGCYKLGNGLIIQWGSSSSSNRKVTFPTPFTTNCQVAGNCNWTGTTNDGHGYVYNITTTGFEFRGVDDDMLPFHWIAVGC